MVIIIHDDEREKLFKPLEILDGYIKNDKNNVV